MANICWNNIDDTKLRRRNILEKTPKNWADSKRLLYTAMELEKMSFRIKDKQEKRTAKRDSDYYYKEFEKLKDRSQKGGNNKKK